LQKWPPLLERPLSCALAVALTLSGYAGDAHRELCAVRAVLLLIPWRPSFTVLSMTCFRACAPAARASSGFGRVCRNVVLRGACIMEKNPGVVERDLELFKRIDLLKRPRASVRTRPELACEPSLGLEAMRGAAISVALLMRCGGASGSCSLRAGRVGRGRSIAWTLPRPAPAPAALGRSGWCGGVMARTAGCGSGTQKCCVSSCRCEHPAREVRCWSVLWVVMGVL